MLFIQNLEPKFYLSGSLIIGFFQIIDGILGVNNFRNEFTAAFSLLELLWFFCTLLFLLNFQSRKLVITTPALYSVYYIFSWMYGVYLLNRNEFESGLQLPEWFPWLAMSFGVVYCLSSYKQLHALKRFK